MTSSNGLYEGVVVAVLAVVLVAFLVGCASLLIPYGLPHTADDVMATIVFGLMAALITLPCAVVAADAPQRHAGWPPGSSRAMLKAADRFVFAGRCHGRPIISN
jgi:hypothetical protein